MRQYKPTARRAFGGLAVGMVDASRRRLFLATTTRRGDIKSYAVARGGVRMGHEREWHGRDGGTILRFPRPRYFARPLTASPRTDEAKCGSSRYAIIPEETQRSRTSEVIAKASSNSKPSMPAEQLIMGHGSLINPPSAPPPPTLDSPRNRPAGLVPPMSSPPSGALARPGVIPTRLGFVSN